MERVAFLIEETNQRLGCLLNPETLVIRRAAGVQPRRSIGGPLSGAGLADDPLLFTGGGRTELQLDLLFDISLAGSSITTKDVRDLTAPLWNLAENTANTLGERQPAQIRFLWGKAWDIPAVVVAAAERLEQFEPTGVPGRSWLRLRLWRVNEPAATSAALQQPPEAPFSPEELAELVETPPTPAEDWGAHEITGGEDEAGELVGERLDQLAFEYYGNAALWRLLAVANDIADPLRLAAGTLLRLPPLSIAVKP